MAPIMTKPLSAIYLLVALACAISACNGSSNGASAATGGAVASPPAVGSRPNGGGAEGPAPASCLAEGEAFTFGTKCCAGLQTQTVGTDIYCLAKIEDGEDGDGEGDGGEDGNGNGNGNGDGNGEGDGNGAGEGKTNGGARANTGGPGPTTTGSGDDLPSGSDPEAPAQITTNSYAAATAMFSTLGVINLTTNNRAEPLPIAVHLRSVVRAGDHMSNLIPFGDPKFHRNTSFAQAVDDRTEKYSAEGLLNDENPKTLGCPINGNKGFITGLQLEVDRKERTIRTITGLACAIPTPDNRLAPYAISQDVETVLLACPTDHVVIGWTLRRLGRWHDSKIVTSGDLEGANFPPLEQIRQETEWRIVNLALLCRPINEVIRDDRTPDTTPLSDPIVARVSHEVPIVAYNILSNTEYARHNGLDRLPYQITTQCEPGQALYNTISLIEKDLIYGAHIAAMGGTCRNLLQKNAGPASGRTVRHETKVYEKSGPYNSSKLWPYGSHQVVDSNADEFPENAKIEKLTCPHVPRSAGQGLGPVLVTGLRLKVGKAQIGTSSNVSYIGSIIGLHCAQPTDDNHLRPVVTFLEPSSASDVASLDCPADHVVVGWRMRRPTDRNSIVNIALLCQPIREVMYNDTWAANNHGRLQSPSKAPKEVQLEQTKSGLYGTFEDLGGDFDKTEQCGQNHVLYNAISLVRKPGINLAITGLSGTCREIRHE